MQPMFSELPEKNPVLDELLKKNKDHKMTPEEKRLQRISFAYGNAAIDDPNVTRKMVEEADKELHPEDYS